MLDLDLFELVVGAILGALASGIPSLLRAIKELVRGSPYKGEFWSYNYSSQRDGTINIDNWKIQLGLAGRLTIKSKNKAGKRLNYQGDVQNLNGRLHVLLRGKDHEEIIHFVYSAPVEATIELLKGVYTAVSLKGEPIAGQCLLSNRELDETEILEELGQPSYLLA